MRLARTQSFVDYMELHQEKRVRHPSGAEIFIADAYRDYDHEFKGPHYQTWFHVSFGEDKPYVGRKLFFEVFKGITKGQRIAAAEIAAEELIDVLIAESGHAGSA